MFPLALVPGRLVCLNKSDSVFYGKTGGRTSAGLRFPPVRDRRSENGRSPHPGLAPKNFAAHKNNNSFNRNPIKIGVKRHILVPLRLDLGVMLILLIGEADVIHV